MTVETPAQVSPDEMAAMLNAHISEGSRVFMMGLDWPEADLRIVVSSAIDVQMRAPCCAKEPETAAFLKEECRSGEVFYDVGANVGAYSLIAASLGCEVFAFEPVAVNYLAATRNALINQLGQKITVLPFALADGRGILRFASEAESVSGTNARSGPLGQTAPVLTMESAVQAFALTPPTILKVDVEGMETAVLAGAAGLLAGVRAALIECSEKTSKEVTRCLEAVGMRLVGTHPRLASGISNLRFSR